ncbi:4Fe-4S dicluster domain-containing protein [Halodesulfurarchaeum sp.]|uniref:4Fe-4S dicluster domain-containing protein n=1 Tax=Halodesulfurarchaeum sp. TaxID=1980530 RepID=UPI002FC2BB14
MSESEQCTKAALRAEVKSLDLDGDSDAVELGMVIDKQRCVGCGGCNIGCARENNLDEGVAPAFSSSIIETQGTFPEVGWDYTPTLCNHCADAPCVSGCPTTALYKGEGGVTMHNPDRCIGCKYCIVNCPYDEIHYLKEDPHQRWDREEGVIEGATASPTEVIEETDREVTPFYNPNREVGEHEHPTRHRGIVEKCTFCIHRVAEGELPACVEACPAEARIFGDLNDPDSKVREILGKYDQEVLKEEKGTNPKVMYVREFNGDGYDPGKGEPGLED